MDNKQAIEMIRCLIVNYGSYLDDKTAGYNNRDLCKALMKAIKSLKAWDKVAKEIYERHERYSICRESECIGNVLWSDELIKVSDCLDIIEKYKKEIEECK